MYMYSIYLFDFIQKWENALAEHIAFATQFVMLGWQDISEDDDAAEAVPLGSMKDTLRVSSVETSRLSVIS